MGRYGTEMVKALSWFCQMDGYSVKITAFDKDPNAADKFTRVCPELMSPEINRVEKEGESRYDISVHYEEDVSTNKFYEKIRKLTDTTYVLVCLGNDELNIGTAIELRSCFAAMGLNPVIQAVVNNTALCEMLRGVTNFKNQDYNIEYIGDFMSSYTESVIISSELERAAISLHEKYGHAEDFWRYEYNYRSSMASAIHMKARIFCGIPGADKKESELTEEEAIIIENLEHRRWNAYMRSQGYSYSGSLDASSRNDLAKKHHNLVPFKRLSEEDKRKDRRVGTK